MQTKNKSKYGSNFALVPRYKKKGVSETSFHPVKCISFIVAARGHFIRWQADTKPPEDGHRGRGVRKGRERTSGRGEVGVTTERKEERYCRFITANELQLPGRCDHT